MLYVYVYVCVLYAYIYIYIYIHICIYTLCQQWDDGLGTCVSLCLILLHVDWALVRLCMLGCFAPDAFNVWGSVCDAQLETWDDGF